MTKTQKPKAIIATKIKSKAKILEAQLEAIESNDSEPNICNSTATSQTVTEVDNGVQLKKESVLRTSSKQTIIISLLRRSEGATIEEIAEATGWQKHSIQGTMSGVLKKKLGFTIISDREGERGRVYHIGAAQEAV